MFRYLRIRRWLCLALLLPLTAGLAFGAEGVIGDLVAPNGPPIIASGCNCPSSGPCPANVKYFGFYETRWRRWPGTEPAPTPAPPADHVPHVEVPPPNEEATGKPGSNEPDTTTPSAAPTKEPNDANPPANPNGAAPGAGVPMLNGLPVPNGTQLPNGAPVPTVPQPNGAPLPNGLPQPNNGLIPNALPTPNQNPANKGSQNVGPRSFPVAESVRPIPSEPVRLSQDWPKPVQPAPVSVPAPATTPPVSPVVVPVAIIPAPTATEIEQQATPASTNEPSYHWPPDNMLRSSDEGAGVQPPAESVPAKRSSASAAAWIEPLPPLSFPNATESHSVPSNSLRIDMPPIVDTKPASQDSSRSENSVTLLSISEKPASAASIPADDLRPNREQLSAKPQDIPATNPTLDSKPDDAVAARFSLSADPAPSQFVHPASWVDRSQSSPPAAPVAQPKIPASQQPATGANNPFRLPASAATTSPTGGAKQLHWYAANSPATLAPLYKCAADDRPAGNVSVNAPGAIASASHPTAQAARPAEIRFSPLRDAVVSVHLSPDEQPATSMSAIDPLQIDRTMAGDQQPAMKALPIQNALPTSRFEASDYVSQDRAPPATSYASTHQPWPNNMAPAPGPRRMTDAALQPASFEQVDPSASPNLATINPLDVARSLGTMPAPAGH